MSELEAVQQYELALKAGQRYYHDALKRGAYPYPPALDELVDEKQLAGRAELGVINIPTELITGTKTAGRTSALAGNFMPLLEENTEFAAKWIRLCAAHLGDEGIRDPIKCYEYLGRFYVLEGNKRASVLMSYGAPLIPGNVTRLIPEYSEDPEIQIYYEFLHFYSLAGLYRVTFNRKGGYTRLLAALGTGEDHVWTDRERKSFSAGFQQFRAAFDKLKTPDMTVTPAEALLVWLKVFPFSDIKDLTLPELTDRLRTIWPDVKAIETLESAEVSTEPESESKTIFSKVLSFTKPDSVKAAFIYAYPPETSAWVRAHDLGRQYMEAALGDRVSATVYPAYDMNYYPVMEQAAADGAKILFATTPPMIDACRRLVANHPDIKVLNCALSQPYTGVRMYYSRMYECKFITGAIAGAMADNNKIGYISNYPIIGDPANVNAFALGARMTNPRAKILLRWSCLPGNALHELVEEGATVISNRDAANPVSPYGSFIWGTYKISGQQELLPLAVPFWDWGKFYERIVLSVLNGTWQHLSGDRSMNYWWGMSSGVVSVQLSDDLPDGVQSLAKMLMEGISSDFIHPFRTRITDQSGNLRNDGSRDFTVAELMQMDWLCDSVDGRIPAFDELIPESRNTVRLLGLYRDEILPEKEAKQL